MALIQVNQYGEKRVSITKEQKEKSQDDDFFGYIFIELGTAIVNPSYVIKAIEWISADGIKFYEIVLTDKSRFFTDLEGQKLLGA